MKTFSMTILAFASAMSLVGCSESASYKVIPLPNSIELSENAAPFVINSGTTIVAEGEEMLSPERMTQKTEDSGEEGLKTAESAVNPAETGESSPAELPAKEEEQPIMAEEQPAKEETAE